jgi:zinc/manganese transport system substrate-binding protein
MKKLLSIMLAVSTLDVYASTINVVAAENFYGELAKEIGGKNVKVTSVISNPDADPHLFTTSPSTSKAFANAQIIIYNGSDYDDWMKQILANVDTKKVTVINVSDLVGAKSGDNPHIWYKPETFQVLAKVIADNISKQNPESNKDVTKNLTKFVTENQQVLSKVQAVKMKYQGTPVTATEPVYGYMADAMGLDMKGLDFQWKIMNDTEPTPKMISDYQDLLNKKQVKVLFYNSQVSDSITENMKSLAKTNKIPVVGVTETMPTNITINKWLENQVDTTANSLSKSQSIK